MKYIITRTSLFDEQPIEEAVRAKVHWISVSTNAIKQPNNKDVWERFVKRNRDITQLSNGNWRGINKEASEVWIVEIDDLLQFRDKCGEDIIIKKPSCEEGYYELEIYDTYRE